VIRPDTKSEVFHFPSTDPLSTKKKTADANIAMYPMKKVMATGSLLITRSNPINSAVIMVFIVD
jgi:hypothetical protein